jgi:HEAT repeat protein
VCGARPPTHIPRAIARFETQRAGDILLARLGKEPDGWVRYKILRALRGWPDLGARNPRARAEFEADAEKTLARAVEVLGRRIAFSEAHARDPRLSTPGAKLLEEILREKEAQAIDRAVRLVALAHPRQTAMGITHAIHSRDARLRAESRELFANVAGTRVAAALNALLDETLTDDERLAQAIAALRTTPPAPAAYAELLRDMLFDESAAVRGIAAHHAGQLGDPALEPTLRAALETEDGIAGGVVQHALDAVEDRR